MLARCCSLRSRAALGRRAALAALLGLLGSCTGSATTQQIQITLPAPEPSSKATVAVEPAILSAHLSRLDDPELGGLDGLMLVFNVELDAAALAPRAFVVSRAEGGLVWPSRALLSPASESDENRTVLLIGEFGGAVGQSGATGPSESTEPGEATRPEQGVGPSGSSEPGEATRPEQGADPGGASEPSEPTHVGVVGPLFSEDGRSLSGLGSSVTPFAAATHLVAVSALPTAPGRCEGAGQLVRTYWSDELRGVEAGDLGRVRLLAEQGEPIHPLRFDDHEVAHAEAGEDNVLDLCLAGPASLRRLVVEAGVFADAAGHASARVEVGLELSR